jgi:hypothetical protein
MAFLAHSAFASSWVEWDLLVVLLMQHAMPESALWRERWRHVASMLSLFVETLARPLIPPA